MSHSGEAVCGVTDDGEDVCRQVVRCGCSTTTKNVSRWTESRRRNSELSFRARMPSRWVLERHTGQASGIRWLKKVTTICKHVNN